MHGRAKSVNPSPADQSPWIRHPQPVHMEKNPKGQFTLAAKPWRWQGWWQHTIFSVSSRKWDSFAVAAALRGSIVILDDFVYNVPQLHGQCGMFQCGFNSDVCQFCHEMAKSRHLSIKMVVSSCPKMYSRMPYGQKYWVPNGFLSTESSHTHTHTGQNFRTQQFCLWHIATRAQYEQLFMTQWERSSTVCAAHFAAHQCEQALWWITFCDHPVMHKGEK